MFVTLEDESANANIIIWPSVFEQNRRAILAATMIGCRGRVQRANNVIHFIVEHVVDLSADLKKVSGLMRPSPWCPAAGMKQSMVVAASTVANLNILG